MKQSRDEADIVLGQPVEAKARVYGDNDILPQNDLNVERYQSTFSHDLEGDSIDDTPGNQLPF